MPKRRAKAAIYGLWCGLIAAPIPATGQGITPESLYGSTVEATVNYDLHSRRGGQEFKNPASVNFRLSIGSGGSITGSVTRTANVPRGPITATRQISATLGRPREIKGSGHGVMVLAGNTLTLLRTFEVGGNKTTITFGAGGRTCTIRSPIMHETGAGPTRRDHIQGGTVEFISARQTSSSCRVSR
jgi:hypothetical protein